MLVQYTSIYSRLEDKILCYMLKILKFTFVKISDMACESMCVLFSVQVESVSTWTTNSTHTAGGVRLHLKTEQHAHRRWSQSPPEHRTARTPQVECLHLNTEQHTHCRLSQSPPEHQTARTPQVELVPTWTPNSTHTAGGISLHLNTEQHAHRYTGHIRYFNIRKF